MNGGPLSLPFTGRGGANGQWAKIGPNNFSYRSIENMYVDGNAGGFFYVDSILQLNPKTGQLCSGRPECPGRETKIRLTQFVFDPSGVIVNEVDLLPSGSLATVICDPLNAVFPGLP